MSALGASSGTSQNPKEKDPRSLSRDHVTNIESGLNGEWEFWDVEAGKGYKKVQVLMGSGLTGH